MLTPSQWGYMMIAVVLRIMVVFDMGCVQVLVLVGRTALIVNVVMTNTEYLEDLSIGKLIQT